MQTLDQQTISPSSKDGEKNSTSATEPKKEFDLLDLRGLWFPSPANALVPVNCDDATNEEFREFINSYVVLAPTVNLDSLMERRDILNFIFSGDGPKPEFEDMRAVEEVEYISDDEVEQLLDELMKGK